MLAKPRAVGGELTAGGIIIHDAWNAATLDIAASQSGFRQSVLENSPPALLMN
jgi:hypothetical protein